LIAFVLPSDSIREITVRALRNAELDVVLLALFASSAAAILMVCLLGLVNLSKNWEGDVLRAGIAHKMNGETMPYVGAQMRWQSLNASLRD